MSQKNQANRMLSVSHPNFPQLLSDFRKPQMAFFHAHLNGILFYFIFFYFFVAPKTMQFFIIR